MRNKRISIKKVIFYICLLGLIILLVMPILWAMLLSLKTNNEIVNSPLSLPQTLSFESSPNLCVHSSSSYVSPSMLPLSSGDLIEWSLVCHSTLSYQKFCDRHSNHYDHPEELHQSVE